MVLLTLLKNFKQYQQLRQNNKYVMIVGKVFLESIKAEGETQPTSQKYKLNIIINDIFYDSLKQFHTKYLCLTQIDTVTIQLIQSNNDRFIGAATISEISKLILQTRTIEINIKTEATNDSFIKLAFSPVLQKEKRRSPQRVSPARRLIDNLPEKEEPKLQSSLRFSRKEKGSVVPQQSLKNQSSFERTQKFSEDQPQDSLKSLAQQRQKILGELFGKFKRDN